MKTNGARKATAAAISRLWSAIATGAAGGAPSAAAPPDGERASTVVAALTDRSLVVHPAARVADDQERDRERDDEQEHRHRRGVAHVEVAEPVLVEEDRVEERRALGVAELERALRARLRGLAGRDVRRDVGLREVLQRPRSPR